jgi:hypothetical protein
VVECVFCVDFGSAYTKVSLRSAAHSTTELLRCDDATVELWAPTVVAAEWVNGQARLDFGYKAAGIKPGGNIAVFTDFKRDLFAATNAPAVPPLEALLGSAEFGDLAAKYGVLPPELAALRSLIGAARTLGGAQSDADSATRRQSNARAATHHYLRWLRERVLEACSRLGNKVLKYEDIPLRLAVPAFGGSGDLARDPGCVRLREALNGTGWRLDDRPFVPEPEANAIGILTKGLNVLTPKTRRLNFREMFSKGPLITVLSGDKDRPTYRALVIDVGAFTTDFAALYIDTGGKAPDTSDGIAFRVTQRSVVRGVTNLDADVRAVLTEDKRSALDGLSRKDFEAFQVGAYTEGVGYRLDRGRVLGGGADRPAVEKCLATFADGLAAEAVAFCQELGPAATMQELILTGGGSSIPAVRTALLKAVAENGQPFVRAHAPDLRTGQAPSPLAERLDARDARGASALGGASIYYERSCY